MEKESRAKFQSGSLTLSTGCEVHFAGPPLDEGPLPALFYFTLSAIESIHLEPINEPSRYLANSNMRVFSFTLPEHDKGFNSHEAMEAWAKTLNTGHNFVEEFVESAANAVQSLTQSGYILPERIAFSGLSRGGFIAAHLAARFPKIQALLGFAPLTQLSYSQYFKDSTHDALADSLNLDNLIDKLTHLKVRFYIGNRDLAVGTEPCFRFIQRLAEAKFQKGERSPNAELILSPSVGFRGHGTLPHVFRDGARWVEHILTQEEAV